MSTEQTPGAPTEQGPYAGKTVAEIVHDYAVTRGDLTEQYARDQLVGIVKGRIAREREAAKVEALREAADAWPREINGEVLRREAAVTMAELAEPYTEADWLRDRAARIAREAQQDGGDRG